MPKQTLTVSELARSIEQARVERSSKHVGTFTRGKGPVVPWERYTCEQSARLGIARIWVRNEMSIIHPAGMPSDAEFEHESPAEVRTTVAQPGGFPLVVDKAGRNLDFNDTMEQILCGEEPPEVVQWDLADWPGIVPSENPAGDADTDEDKGANVGEGESTPEIEQACRGEPTERFVERDGKPDIIFRGWKIAQASSSTDDSTPRTKISVGRTCGGKYIVGTRDESQGETRRADAAVCASLAELIDALGHERLGKHLQEELGLAELAAEWID